MMNSIVTLKNHGLQLKPIVVNEHYIFGGYTQLGGEVLQPDHNWAPFLPIDEFQNLYGAEPMACVTYGTLNAVEMLERRLFGDTRNWSDCFLATLSGTLITGSDPHAVAETLRKQGVVPEEDFPVEPWMTSFATYYSRKITDTLLQVALAFQAEYVFGHEWVPTSPASLKGALKFSPLGVSVCAWVQDAPTWAPGGKQLFYKPQGMSDNHWCVLYDYVEGEYWCIFDSYDNSHKKYRWDSNFQAAKRYSLVRQIKVEPAWRRFLVFIYSLIPTTAGARMN